ncbi:hypothetical protein QCA50_016049 [Cerrena zonata]|uniref:Uncharacterized protein n=1 Tax=Cerrena zonata TaxID=2478898 RepID=A0AAW0FJ20_9APHY
MSVVPTQKPSPHSTGALVGRLKSTRNSVERFEVPIPLFTLCTVGRSRAWCTTVVHHKYVGTLHFGIDSATEEDNSISVYIMETGTCNGTFVNSVALEPLVPRMLVTNDIVAFGTGGEDGYLECKFTQFVPHSFMSRYDVIEKLGQGGFGTVCSCRQRATGQLLAAKMIRVSKMSLVEGNEYIRRECEIVKRLRHPNIVPVFEILQEPWGICLVMERAAEGDLGKYIKENGALDELVAKSVTLDVTGALKYLHKQQIAHRDIKPNNILISSVDPLITKVCDFGLAKSMADERMATVAGTPHFMAPEVANGQGSYDLTVDSWSLGCVIFNMLAGVRPFGTEHGRIKYALRGTSLPTSISADAKIIMRKLLQFDPRRRLAICDVERQRWMKDVYRMVEL